MENPAPTVLIFANGPLSRPPDMASRLGRADIIIAADGGGNHCVRLGALPDILLGDLDSVDPDVLEKCADGGTEIQRHPERKDATDLELCLDLALLKGAETVWLVGVHGGRWDMSLANILLAASERYHSMQISLLGEDCTMNILRPGRSNEFRGLVGDTLSLLPIKGDVTGITLSGFEYPLDEHTIPFGSTLGVSNIVRSDPATELHDAGILLSVQEF